MSNTARTIHPPRAIFLGMQGNFSHPPLCALLEAGIEVCAVVIPAPQGPRLTRVGFSGKGPVRRRERKAPASGPTSAQNGTEGTRKGPHIRSHPPLPLHTSRGLSKHLPVSEGPMWDLPAIRRREQPQGSRSVLPVLQSPFHNSILQLAWEGQIPVWEVNRLSDPETINVLVAYQPDVICVACFSQRIPRTILDIPPLGCLNVHPSLLPVNRGPEPLFWTFREGSQYTGVTIHLMDEGLDTGPIVAQEVVEVPDGISYAQLEAQCAALGGTLLARSVWDLYNGLAMPVAQDETKSSYHGFPSEDDFVIPVAEWSARHVYNFICGVALCGTPIMLQVGNQSIPVSEAISYSHEDTGVSDSDVSVQSGEDMWVRCKEGWVRVRG